MKPTPNFELHPAKILLNSIAVQHLDRLYQALETIHSGGTLTDGGLLGEDLAALAGLFDETPDVNAEAHWSAEYYPDFSGNGGTLSLKERAGCQHLTISRDRHGALYNGIWSCLDENTPGVLMFNVTSSIAGVQLIINGDEIERSIALGNNVTGIKWASTTEVLSFVPEWLVAKVEAAIQVVLPPQPVGPAVAEASAPEKTQQKVCANCGAPLEPNMRFCGQCAAPVQAEQSPAP